MGEIAGRTREQKEDTDFQLSLTQILVGADFVWSLVGKQQPYTKTFVHRNISTST